VGTYVNKVIAMMLYITFPLYAEPAIPSTAIPLCTPYNQKSNHLTACANAASFAKTCLLEFKSTLTANPCGAPEYSVV